MCICIQYFNIICITFYFIVYIHIDKFEYCMYIYRNMIRYRINKYMNIYVIHEYDNIVEIHVEICRYYSYVYLHLLFRLLFENNV